MGTKTLIELDNTRGPHRNGEKRIPKHGDENNAVKFDGVSASSFK